MSQFNSPLTSKSEDVEIVIVPRVGDIGNFEVRRALPSRERQMVGPFIFWDQMGPGEFITGQGVDVRPHPHIGLSTVTYLFTGSLDHRDSLGTSQRILPGEINLMTAGSGIVHSERTGQDIRHAGSSLFGLQTWLALPVSKEEMACTFQNYSKESLPLIQEDGITIRIIAGSIGGVCSPVKMHTETIYADIELRAGAKFSIGKEHEERALFALHGELEIGGQSYAPNQMLVLRSGDDITVKALTNTRVMLLGGEAADGPRYMWWNFVSSSKERIEQAKEDWKQNRFAQVPGETEKIPLPQ